MTITLALFTFVFTHYAGIRKKGALGYFRGWAIPSAPPVMRQFIFFMHIISEFFRLVSLSVRLFANMLAGHAILAVFFAMALVFQSYLIATVLQVGSVVLLPVRDLHRLHPGIHLRHPLGGLHRRALEEEH